MDWMLTEEEIQAQLLKYPFTEFLCKAQARKLVGWGDTFCVSHGYYPANTRKWECRICWQQLRKDVGLEEGEK